MEMTRSSTTTAAMLFISKNQPRDKTHDLRRRLSELTAHGTSRYRHDLERQNRS